ncbi:DUF3040 domain-containing protein [Amycolatopsis echigonensis]|uniref:DUF3040 domain-containing protein n=1 Tax=Amycolatopsis echigonensis TaxID=2576905 RepID=A0A2N3WRV7_9PSEU|nr:MULTISPECIES: DUF3040 domain-containing protein [Amycolatopsis]MBB2501498.1 DUF3040 domain-containing protein [Amycolatopsis echigonensis]PKV96611.1 Protein of unknown function (DUF3040) [Amycolatopsis niigatensis]
MLPYRDRSALRKIEEELAASDPVFAATLSQGVPPAESRRWQKILVLAEVTVALMLVFGLMGGETGWFLWGLLAAPLLVWTHRTMLRSRREGAADDQP